MKLFKKSYDFPEEAGSLPCESCLLSGDREILTRESTGEDSSLGNKSNCSQVISTYLLNVSEQCHIRPMAGQYLATLLIDLHCGNGFRACALECDREATDPGEEIDMGEISTHPVLQLHMPALLMCQLSGEHQVRP